MRTEKIVFEQDGKEIIQYGEHFFTRVPENGEYFESQYFNTLERAKASLGIKNIYLDRLKQEYKQQEVLLKIDKNLNLVIYQVMRLFCLDTNLVSFNDIELMEYEVNNEVNNSVC